jgi:hypothetical protein
MIVIVIVIVAPAAMVRSRCGMTFVLAFAGILFVVSRPGMSFVVVMHARLHFGLHVRVRAGHVLAFHALAVHSGTVCESCTGYEQSSQCGG